ncbi:hypothetical protein L2X99_09650 [Microbacterium sp. KUDC0406]|uniref:hypothetical protein n=1 Tax=Microbacterium sp. KUDC0406 TaxID=2909588 RepID=UPI001F4824B8|nr:hypothetical protein [Microbacterium sp. KUDC0406]UJP08779.1 hypothetical protein L2X99_09650 [Microbacterium sp. KUDC0406]
MNVTSRVGFRVMTRVTGEYRTEVAPAVNARYTMSWNPFQPGTADVEYTIENTGNTRVAVTPTVSVEGPFGTLSQAQTAAKIEELAPGEQRKGAVRLTGVWPTGPLSVRVTADAESVVDGDAGTGSSSVETTVPAWPWPQLIALGIAVLLIVLTVVDRRRRRRSLQEQLERAREEGRREAEKPAQ